MGNYQPPWYLNNGVLMTFATDIWYGKTWKLWGDQAPWLNHLPLVSWQECRFTGADGVPLWGVWSCPEAAKGTIIISTGLTGKVNKSWYAHLFARKAYNAGFAVLFYDWRGRGRTAELSPTPPSYGWREGDDLVLIADELIKMGLPNKVVLVGFSMGGQISLWGLKAAQESKDNPICGAATLSCNLESNLSLAHLRKSWAGRTIERSFVKNLRQEVIKRSRLFPETVTPGIIDLIHSIDEYDRHMSIDYYGFTNIFDFYRATSALYIFDKIKLPFLIIYAQDDPVFDPDLIMEVQRQVKNNPNSSLILTEAGGHNAYINRYSKEEDIFWGMNRLLEFCEKII